MDWSEWSDSGLRRQLLIKLVKGESHSQPKVIWVVETTS